MRKFSLHQQLGLALFKMYAELKAEAARSYLGVLWWLIEPVLYLGAFYVLFVLVMGRNDANFIPNFLCGIVVWKWFDAGVKSGGSALMANAGLLQQVSVPKYIFAVSAVLGSTLRFLLVFCILCIFLLVYGVDYNGAWFWVVPLIVVQLFLITSLALLLSSFMSFIPDFKVALENGMLFLFFISGVLFNIKDAREPIRDFLLINPMASLIEMYRDSLLHGLAPDCSKLLLITGVSSVLLALSLFLLRRWSQKYAKVRF